MLGKSPNAPIAMIGDEERKFYAMQFHPEVVHTPQGAALLRNFVRKIAGASGDWTMRAFKDEAIEKIRAQVGKGRVICGLSGGVDSAVAAVLIHEAIGEQLTCVFVDHGLLRLGEAEKVVALFRDHYNIPLVHVDASRHCSSTRSHGVDDPETKRKTIGKLFIDVFEAEAKKIGGARIPRAGHALSRRDRERVVHRRPVGDDQVAPQCRRPARAHEHEAGRAAARTVQGRGEGARPRARPAGSLRRPPSVSRARVSPSAARRRSRARSSTSCARPTTIYIDEIRKAGLYDEIWQAFAVLLPVKTVGVMGDGRTYDYRRGPARRDLDRRHDGGLLSVRHEVHRPRRDPHHQRGQRRQPRRL